jgi:predicted nucleic acid-binding protein
LGLQKDASKTGVKVIIDTCAWAEFLRRSKLSPGPVAQEVSRLVKADVVQLMGAIRQKLLSGAFPADRFEHLRDYLRFYPNIPVTEEDDERAAAYYNQLRRHGVAGTGTDLLICAVAVRHGFKIFTTDKDFVAYARHLPIKLHRPRQITAQTES